MMTARRSGSPLLLLLLLLCPAYATAETIEGRLESVGEATVSLAEKGEFRFPEAGREAITETLRETVLRAGAIRFKPILLTALAAMLGASVILFDPIFQGLAISLLFGLASSTLLTVLVIPAIYIVLRDDGRPLDDPAQART